MKRTSTIALVILGTLGTAACGNDEVETFQRHYKTQADCHQDWNVNPSECRPSSSGGYTGPRYFYSNAGYPMMIGSNGTTTQMPASSFTASRASQVSQGIVSAPHGSSLSNAARASGAVARGGFGSAGHSAGG